MHGLQLHSSCSNMAGDQAKKAARRKAEALQRWGGVAGGIFAVTLILHLFFFKASLTAGNYFVLLLQLAVYAACLFFISNGAANAAEGRGSALDQGVESRTGGEMWKDLFYINAFTQILSLFTSWGWTAFWIVPIYMGYQAYSHGRGMLNKMKTMMPGMAGAATGAPQDQGAGDAGEEGRDPDRRAAKKERQQQAMMKRAKGISMR